MSSLKTYKFSDLYEMSSGISSKPDQAGHGFPFASFSSVFNNQFLPSPLPELMDTSKKEREAYSIEEGDIFLTRTSETLDELGMSSVATEGIPNATYSGFLKRLRPKQHDISYHKFMAFYLRSKLFRKTMSNNAIMTLRASLNEQIFSYLHLLLPEFDEQKKIGDYLYLLNQKIELNNKINAELEAMAKLIYNYWFVQFDFPDANGKPYKSSGGKMVYNEALKREIPKGWSSGNVLHLANLLGGGTPKTKVAQYWSGSIPFFTPADAEEQIFSMNTKELITDQGLSSCSSKLYKKGTIFITARGTVGKVNIASQDTAMNQSCYALQGIGKVSPEFMYFFTRQLVEYIKLKASGSIFKALVTNDFKYTEMTLPTESLIDQYTDRVKPFFDRVLLGKLENKQLTELRDWLLPMLMNGQVKVNDTTA